MLAWMSQHDEVGEPTPGVAAPAGPDEASLHRLLAQHLQAVREDERAHLARDLHDELGSLLTLAKLDAARLKSRLATTAPELLEPLDHLLASLDSMVALKRRIVQDLHPLDLEHLGLVPALEIVARDVARGAGIEVHCELSPVQLNARAELAVYRLMQEALNNVAKHAAAHRVWVRLVDRGGRVEAAVRDDGKGFDLHGVGAACRGLLGMRLRTEAEQGWLTVLTAPGQGTWVKATLPCSS
jgi:signal transduction histidine kinase